MQAKLKRSSSDKRKKLNLFEFFGGLKNELKKVSWTTKPELISATKIVIASTFCFGIGIYLIDLFIKGVLGLIQNIIFFIFG